MADGIDDNTIFLQVAALQRLNLTELRNKWVELFDNEPPPYNKKFLLKRLAYRLQELYFGGLSEPIKKKLEEISDNSGRNTIENFFKGRLFSIIKPRSFVIGSCVHFSYLRITQ